MIAPPKPPSPHDELEALIKEARARQLRRRLLGAAGVAIAAAVGLSIHAFVTGGNPSNVAQPTAEGGGATGPLCRAAQLSAVASFQGATGSQLGAVKLTNSGGTACSLPSAPPLVRIVWDGRKMAARQIDGMAASGGTPVRVLAPGDPAFIFMQWSNWCGKPKGSTIISPTFELHFRGGLRLATVVPGMNPPRCDGAASTIAVGRPVTD
jgi:Protein of unknown function (DUF4232)